MKAHFDKWDKKLVMLCKSNNQGIDDIYQLWAKRNAVDVSNVDPKYIVEAMLEIWTAYDHNVNPDRSVAWDIMQLVDDIQPANMWKFGRGKSSTNLYENFIVVLASRLRLMDVQHIPFQLD